MIFIYLNYELNEDDLILSIMDENLIFMHGFVHEQQTKSHKW